MEIEVFFESDEFHTDELCNEIIITIDAYTNDGTDLDWEIVDIYDNTAKIYRKLKDFSDEETEKILDRCRNAAEEEAPQILEGHDSYNDEEYF